MQRSMFAAALIAVIVYCDTATAAPRLHPVRVEPNVADAHTTFLATFNASTSQADKAIGDAAFEVKNARFIPGHDGSAIAFDEGGNLKIDPNNLNPKAGTIELIVRDDNPGPRHSVLWIVAPHGRTGARSQMGGAVWWHIGGGDSVWVHDVDVKEAFPKQWFYLVMGWDTATGAKTIAAYTLDGRIHENRLGFRDSGKMDPAKAEVFAQGGFQAMHVGAPGLVIDTIRISNTYRSDLLDPVRDWGSVERFNSYSGQSLFDDETRMKRWVAGENLTAPPSRVTTFEPMIRIREKKYQASGKRKPPVPVVQCSPGSPTFDLDFGALDIGCYVVRVIAAVATKDIEQYRKPVYVDFFVNDQVGGGESHYRHRVPYWDEFYAVTELYINVDEKRAYRGRLSAGRGGLADLYVHAIEFHDALAGLPRRAAKTKPGRFTYEERQRLREHSSAEEVMQRVNQQASPDIRPGQEVLTGEARRERDDLLWNAFPPINSQFVAEYDESFAAKAQALGTMSVKEANEQHGTWVLGSGSTRRGWRQPVKFHNQKLDLTYTREDLAAHKLLPDPYPWKDDGHGVWFPKKEGMENATHFMPLAVQLGYQWEGCWNALANWHGGVTDYELPYYYHALGDENAARDAAFILARWAYTYPTHTDAQTLGYATTAPASMYNRDMRLHMRALMFYWGSSRGLNLQMGLARAYDFLFDYIHGNQELADAVGRYIPWVKSDEDLRRLIETRILQYGAKQSIRFQLSNSKQHAEGLLHNAVIQQDPDVTRPWMEALWTNTHVYPHPKGGLPEFVSTTTQRDGTTDIGSVFYTWGGSPFLKVVNLTRAYVANGGDARFDLSNFRYYGKMPIGCFFPLDSAVAGGYPMTIGDVGGPDKPRMVTSIKDFEESFRYGYAWTGDGRLAWLIKRYFGRRSESDSEWVALESAADAFGRNPYLAQQSRLMVNWAGILESGQASDDYRFKRTAFMRVGTGVGHAHNDALDLQMIAHGVRVLNDLGHRGGYSMPKAPRAITHNRVVFNSKRHPRQSDWNGYAWIDALKDLEGARYMHGTAIPAHGEHAKRVKLFERQVALIDVDEGKPATQAYEGLYEAHRTKHAADVVTPNSYVFDVQRVDGGMWQTWCFHGTISDEFTVNLQNQVDVGQATHEKTTMDKSDDAKYLIKFLDGPGLKYAGDVADSGTVVATWRLRRTEETINGFLPHTGEARACEQRNAEKKMLGVDYDESAPGKYTRVHLFGRSGERILVGQPSPVGPEHAEHSWPFLMVQDRNDEDQASIYPAIIEPYAGDPFIKQVAPVAVEDNDADALRAVAVRVSTMNGHEDLCISDGHADKWRRIGDVRTAAKFALLSRDSEGLRIAQVVEGLGMESPAVALKLDRADYSARIAKLDYLERTIHLDTVLPEKLIVGDIIEIGNEQHRTSFTIAAAERDGEHTRITLDKPIDLSYARVVHIDADRKQVFTNIRPATAPPGANAGLTVTNEDMTRAWRASILPLQKKYKFGYQLEGDLNADDLPVGSTLRLWEFGLGDEVRIATHAQVRRNEDGRFILKANTPVTVKIGRKSKSFDAASLANANGTIALD